MPTSSRPPEFAGAFYPAEARVLVDQIETCFLDDRGPGELPARHRDGRRTLVAAIVPHAGYVYSGAIAAHVYARIAAERPPGSVLILGVDHNGAGRGAALSARPWQTPLGPVAIDGDLVRALTAGPVEVDEAAHKGEHSIEVQLPFLEYVLPQPSFVPLQVRYGPYKYLEEVGDVVREVTRDRDTLLLASTDFSHYVPPEVADRLDHLAIEAILAQDARRLYDEVDRHQISMCGIAPTTAMLAALRGRALTATLLRWGHSGEVAPSRQVVGYAAVLLEEKAPASAPVK